MDSTARSALFPPSPVTDASGLVSHREATWPNKQIALTQRRVRVGDSAGSSREGVRSNRAEEEEARPDHPSGPHG